MLDSLMLAQQQSNGTTAIVAVFYLATIVLMFASMWVLFKKAGIAGWLGIIPIVNLYFLLKIAGKPGWLVIGMFIPFVSLIVWIYISLAVAKAFGKGIGFGIGLALLGIVFFPILAFGSAEYQGPEA